MENTKEPKNMNPHVDEIQAEELAGETTTARSPSRKEMLKGIFQTILLIFKKSAIGIRNVYGKLVKAEDDVRIIDDIKGAFKHIPLRKRGASALL